MAEFSKLQFPQTKLPAIQISEPASSEGTLSEPMRSNHVCSGPTAASTVSEPVLERVCPAAKNGRTLELCSVGSVKPVVATGESVEASRGTDRKETEQEPFWAESS